MNLVHMAASRSASRSAATSELSARSTSGPIGPCPRSEWWISARTRSVGVARIRSSSTSISAAGPLGGGRRKSGV
jgi:hypothetical protein